MKFTGAFIIPKAAYKGENYLYFGIERSTGEVSAFGGKRNSQQESIHKCARREFQEESLGVFARDATIKMKLADQRKYKVEKVDKDDTCVTYFMPLELKNNPIKAFSDKIKTRGLKHHQKEMTKIIAVKAKDVINMVKASAGNPMPTLQGHKVRPLLQYVLREGVKRGLI